MVAHPEQPQPHATEHKLMVLKAGKDAGFIEYAYLAPKHLKRQFSQICSTSIDSQCEYWLKSFVKEFEGRIDEVLELAEEFKAFLPEDADCNTATHLDAFPAHVFLERKGQTLSVLELRQVMRDICADHSDLGRFSFIEYLVWSYQKTLKELFMVKPYELEPLLKGLYAAMHQYQVDKAQHDDKVEELVEAVGDHGGAGEVVRGFVAAAALKVVISRGATRRQKDAVYHKYKQHKAQKEFDARKAVELAAKKESEALERRQGKARMAARMGAMSETSTSG